MKRSGGGVTLYSQREADQDTNDEDGSDNDEFVVHQEGHEEIHITRKAKKQLK